MNQINKNLLLLSGLCVTLVISRVIKTDQFSFVFMFWNLFLGFVPFWISSYLIKRKQISYFKLIVLSALWLLFLPNAPYMLTDLFHLYKRADLPIWFDLILILSFAITGMYLFYLSIHQMKRIARLYFPVVNNLFSLIVLFFLVSYGVYIGRFLRVNSWDVIHPIQLAKICLKPLIYLPSLKDTCAFTMIFTVLLLFMFQALNPVFTRNTNN